LSPLKLALMADQRRASLALSDAEPIAVVGMGCRFPGAPDPQAFWRLLRDGVESIAAVPPDRWDADALYDPDPDRPGHSCTRLGSFLTGIDRFDPQFFGISPREAWQMDPQQRLVLEVVWEALEDAGIAPEKLAGTLTGLFLGISAADYAHLFLKSQGDVNGLTPNSGTAAAFCVAAGRVSHALGLQGPAVALDTACSSSLVSVHLACQSLRRSECDTALAGGVNLMVTPHSMVAFSRAHMLAADGRCKTFDARADGYGRGEGCGFVVLRRLADAVAQQDRILAVLRGSAINHDGRSAGLTVPNGPAQEAVIRRALASGAVTAAQVSFVEAHGTGTSLGDPIEVGALAGVYGARRDRIALGSVKTNIGHLEAAAGIAGLIKVVLALQHRQIPPHLHFQKPSPHIPWSRLPFDIPRVLTEWTPVDGRRIAGVSSFGFSGTNAHVLVEEAPPLDRPSVDTDRPYHLLCVSARTDAALDDLAERYAVHLETASDPVADVCHTAAVGRNHFGRRLAVVASDAANLAKRLREAARETASRSAVGDARPTIAFLFTGQGAQYPNMARELFETQRAFRQILEACDRAFRDQTGRSLLAAIYPEATADPGELDRTALTQPALFSIEYALATLWKSWGVEPGVVMGHSVGEYVAACVAGAMPFEAALQLVAIRGRLMQSLPSGSAMAAVEANAEDVEDALTQYGLDCVVAAYNSPTDTTIAGSTAAIAEACGRFTAQNVRATTLRVSHAFHSPWMDPILDEFERAAARVTTTRPAIGLVTNVTGGWLRDAPDAGHWRRHLRQSVRCAQGFRTLATEGVDVWIEIGPQPALVAYGRRTVKDGKAVWLSSLRKGRSDWRQLLGSLGAVYTLGCDIDWLGFDRDYSRRRVALPTYPFQRARYWVPPIAATHEPVAGAPGRDPAAARRLDSPAFGNAIVHEHRVGVGSPIVRDHRIAGVTLVPAALFVSFALAAGESIWGRATIETVDFERPLGLSDDSDQLLQVIVRPDAGGTGSFEIVAARADDPDRKWTTHVTGRLQGETPARLDKRRDDTPLKRVEPAAFYQALQDSGFAYGPSLRALVEIEQSSHGAVGRIELTEPARANQSLARAVALDCGFQLLGAALGWSAARRLVPATVSNVWFGAGATDSTCHLAVVDRQGDDSIAARLLFIDRAGQTVGQVGRVVLRAIAERSIRTAGSRRAEEFEIEWRERSSPVRELRTAPSTRTVVIIGGGRGLGDKLAERIVAAGDRSVKLSSTEDLFALVRSFAGTTGPDVIVYLGALELPEAHPDESLSASQRSAWSRLLAIAQTAIGATWSPRLVVITRGAQDVDANPIDVRQSPFLGFVRTLGLEHPGLRPVAIDLDPISTDRDETAVLTELAEPDGESVAWRGDRRLVPRLKRVRPRDVGEASTLVIGRPGILDSLNRCASPPRPPASGEVQVAVRATGLNFRDVLTALDLYPGEPTPLGLECAGTVTAVGDGVTHVAVGTDVVALAPSSFSTMVTTAAPLVCRAPQGTDPTAAATIPVAFLTAAYALRELARLRPGERVLIHAASGGVGLAAIQIARAIGAELFATAGSEQKREYLSSLGIAHVYDSRSLAFADRLRSDTNGQGVDVVLNSLTGDAIACSMSALGRGGRFVEIGKIGVWDAERVASVRPDVRYHLFDLGEEVRRDPASAGLVLSDVVDDVRRGVLTPLPTTVFDATDTAAAFRLMAQARHIGKVVVTQPAPAASAAIQGDATYLVSGGFGALGTTVARWLVARGARTLALIGRHAASRPLSDLEPSGVHVVAFEADVADRAALATVLDNIRSTLPPLRGIVHAAGVLDDGVVTEQSWARMQRVFAPKIDGAWNLHELTRCDALDLFVLFSSAAAVFGSPGQIAYSAANAFLDALAGLRRQHGLPALAIDWGPWEGAGMAARTVGLSADERLPVSDALAALDGALARSARRVVVVPSGWAGAIQRISPGGPPAIMEHVAARAPKAEASELLRALNEAMPGARRDLIARHLEELSRRILGWPVGEPIEQDRPLNELGFDSLMAVELRNAVAHALGRPLPATILFDYPTIDALADHLAGTVQPSPPTVGPAVVSPLTHDTSIAIVGMACRFPGGADSPAAFWRLLKNGRDAIGEVPPDRWDVDAYYDPDLASTRSMNTRWGGFLESVDQFDRQFFGISAQEAANMDPQQRLLLEVAWEAFERAGLPPSRLAGTPAGVFVGICSCDYSALLSEAPARGGTGLALSIAANRLSYLFDLRGPSLAIDTACSSSLVAVDLACQSLRSGASRVALAGGVNVILLPETTIAFSQAGMMAPDGRCKTFDARADGYVRSEGCGLVVLKPLADADRDGDDILAVIRGSAVNQDGRSSGLTAPNGLAQQAVIRRALANGRVDPSEVDYVEAHGTGTPLGDTIEVGALWSVMGQGRARANPLVIGSVKTNLGHLEGAAGIAGLIKVVLALNAGEIPPHLHFDRANPDLTLDRREIEVPIAVRTWQRGRRRRVAGVSSFGFGGTNAHVVIEEGPERTESALAASADVFTVSARSDTALRALATRYAEDLAAEDVRTLEDLCFASSAGRTHFSHRAAFVVESRAQLVRELVRFADRDSGAGIHGVAPRQRPKVAFVAPDPAAVTAGMGRELLALDPRLGHIVDRCADVLKDLLDRPLRECLLPKPNDRASIDRPRYAYPAAFVWGYALAELWRAWGVAPDGVCGRGVGELVAACQAQVVGLEDALRLAAAAGQAAEGSQQSDVKRLASQIVRLEPAILFAPAVAGRVLRPGNQLGEWFGDRGLPHDCTAATLALAEAGCRLFIDLGNGPLAESMRVATPSGTAWYATLGPDGTDWRSILATIAALYVQGVEIDWVSGRRPFGRRMVSLPTYPFERQRYWIHDEPILVRRGGGSLT